MPAKKPASLAIALLALAGMLFALVAAKCDSTTEFIPFVQEICTDKIDNDGDGLSDCRDADCNTDCVIEVFINPIEVTTSDTVYVTGTHRKAVSITLTVTPAVTKGAVSMIAGTDRWEAKLTDMGVDGIHTVQAIASAEDRRDTATATFDWR